MKRLTLIILSAFFACAAQAQRGAGVHEGNYQKNLTYKGPLSGDDIIYTLYLPPATIRRRDLIRWPFSCMVPVAAIHPPR